MINSRLHTLQNLLQNLILLEESGELAMGTDATAEGLVEVREEIHPELRNALMIGELEILIHKAMELSDELKELEGEL